MKKISKKETMKFSFLFKQKTKTFVIYQSLGHFTAGNVPSGTSIQSNPETCCCQAMVNKFLLKNITYLPLYQSKQNGRGSSIYPIYLFIYLWAINLFVIRVKWPFFFLPPTLPSQLTSSTTNILEWRLRINGR